MITRTPPVGRPDAPRNLRSPVRAPSRLARGPSVREAFGVLRLPDQASLPLVATWSSTGAAPASQPQAHAMPTAKTLRPSALAKGVEEMIQGIGLACRTTGMRRSNSARWGAPPLYFRRPRFLSAPSAVVMEGRPGRARARQHLSRSPRVLLVASASLQRATPRKRSPRRSSATGKPQIPRQVLLQSQIQVMRQLFEAHLAQPDQLTVEHRVGAKEDET